MRLIHTTCAVAFLSIGFSQPLFAQHDGDVQLDLTAAPNVRIRTNIVRSERLVPSQLFISTFGETVRNFTDEPGFDSAGGTFPPSSSIGFRIRRALREWNGRDFTEIPQEQVEIAFGPIGPVLTPRVDGVVNGFALPVTPNGEWHRHLEFTLGDPGDQGLYLLELELFSTVSSIGGSRPFWLIMNQNEPAQSVGPAARWVEENLIGICRVDWNDDNTVDSQDFFDFIADFFSNNADFNRDGSTNSQDFFDFIAAFFRGCQ